MILLILSGVVVGVVITPEVASAWGAGMHVAQSSFMLENSGLMNSQIAKILLAYPLDYIYGALSADIFIGKGYRRRDDHCHNWSIGFKTLDEATDEPTKAFAYGYLTHLAADVIAHNYLVPSLLYATPATRGLGHLFWEYRADRFIKKKYWRLAKEAVSKHNHANDTLIKKVMNRSSIKFRATKMVFKRSVVLQDLTKYRDYVEEAHNNSRIISRKQVALLNNYAINLIVDLLKNEEKAICLKYDPVGTDNTIEAKRLRKKNGFASKIYRGKFIFDVPEDIVNIQYVDHEAQRL